MREETALGEAHVDWFLRTIRPLLITHFEHGFKHGAESTVARKDFVNASVTYSPEQYLFADVALWGINAGIVPALHTADELALIQLRVKMKEELEELEKAIEAADNAGIIDGLGDSLVVLIQIARLVNQDLFKCLASAYETIKKRKGKMKDGVFVRDSPGSFTQPEGKPPYRPL